MTVVPDEISGLTINAVNAKRTEGEASVMLFLKFPPWALLSFIGASPRSGAYTVGGLSLRNLYRKMESGQGFKPQSADYAAYRVS